MTKIVYFDTEVSSERGKVCDIGAIDELGSTFHSPLKAEFQNFLHDAAYVCGHNIIQHDLKFVGDCVPPSAMIVDTLFLSPLLFPHKPYHALVKDDKLFSDELNNPLNDAKKVKSLLDDERAAWQLLSSEMRSIFTALLTNQSEFSGFFHLMNSSHSTVLNIPITETIAKIFHNSICEYSPLMAAIQRAPIELAYALALIHGNDLTSLLPPWVALQYPRIERLIRSLRAKPCLHGCPYCRNKLDPKRGLKKYFGFDDFRLYAGEPLQENAARAALEGKSSLVIFPTGGGKSITFQIPALMSGESEKGLTVIISPLQSLMKDQVDNLEARGITRAVAISGLQDPIERAEAIKRVADGSACILYIAPESLRSSTTLRLLQQRNVVRFVIDEAHCFSSWGQDFRPDYLYIGDFIKELCRQKFGDTNQGGIPISCFTATAKQRVIEDICAYFKEKLGTQLEIYTALSRRENLHYKVIECTEESEKYNRVRILLELYKCPTIIYVSRTRRAQEIAEKLVQDGFSALAFHGKMERERKTHNQNSFLSGNTQIMVATTAFGMGVDKKDIGLIIHYDISDSIENYVQEAGRAGRDENIQAQCYILFNEGDLDKHFLLLNQTKLNFSEIQQIWKAVKECTKARLSVQQSALEIARTAGWNDTAGTEMETRVITAITALEQSNYLKRGQNSPRIYASSIRCKSMTEASQRITASPRFLNEAQRNHASRIMANLFSARSRKSNEPNEAESRVDYLSENLGIVREDVIRVVQILREEKILDDQQDLSAHFTNDANQNRSLRILNEYLEIELFLQKFITEEKSVIHIKRLNEEAEKAGCRACNTRIIHTLLNYWEIKHLARRQWDGLNNAHVTAVLPPAAFVGAINKRGEIAREIVKYLHQKIVTEEKPEPDQKTVSITFSVIELARSIHANAGLFQIPMTSVEIEDALFYLSRIGAMKIEGGFMVVYNRLTIERKEPDLRVRYKKDDYKKLDDFYKNRVQQIHIVGEYANKMLEGTPQAIQFVEDYFRLNSPSFMERYFTKARQLEMRLNITPKKYRELFDSLSDTQRRVIDDRESRVIVVTAGPGSGKTKLLVHKLAALLLMEDVKHEQLLMLTFSRAAATEFKARLVSLVGNAANFVEIKTFYSWCFDLLGRVGSLENTDNIIGETIQKIRAGEVESSRISKAVLVIDEAQDMSGCEYELVRLLMEYNEAMRVIAVGDDDQNIYSFRGSDSKYFAALLQAKGATGYELVTNYRSAPNLVAFSNQFLSTIKNRMKHQPIVAQALQNGTLTLQYHTSPHLAQPLLHEIRNSGLTGSTAVLTFDNVTATTITGLLNYTGFPARLIQSNDGFSLADIDEVKFFSRQIADFVSIPKEEWEAAKRRLHQDYPSSSRGLEVCTAIIKDFESANTHSRYRTDFEVFVRESRLEDFFSIASREVITVSTMHKSKGREFDNVFLLLPRTPTTDEERRLIYVAMSRARSRLVILTTSRAFNFIQTEDFLRKTDRHNWGEPSSLTLFLTHRDIWLSSFKKVQPAVNKLYSGDDLKVVTTEKADQYICTNKNGQVVLHFSKKFQAELRNHKARDYIPTSARINFILWWKEADNPDKTTPNNPCKIILPELHLQKSS